MRCEELEDDLSAYLDGELPPQRSALVADHLSSCKDCSAMLAGLSHIDTLVAALPREAAPAHMGQTLHARVATQPKPLDVLQDDVRPPVVLARPAPNLIGPIAFGIAAMVMLCAVAFVLLPAVTRTSPGRSNEQARSKSARNPDSALATRAAPAGSESMPPQMAERLERERQLAREVEAAKAAAAAADEVALKNGDANLKKMSDAKLEKAEAPLVLAPTPNGPPREDIRRKETAALDAAPPRRSLDALPDERKSLAEKEDRAFATNKGSLAGKPQPPAPAPTAVPPLPAPIAPPAASAPAPTRGQTATAPVVEAPQPAAPANQRTPAPGAKTAEAPAADPVRAAQPAPQKADPAKPASPPVAARTEPGRPLPPPQSEMPETTTSRARRSNNNETIGESDFDERDGFGGGSRGARGGASANGAPAATGTVRFRSRDPERLLAQLRAVVTAAGGTLAPVQTRANAPAAPLNLTASIAPDRRAALLQQLQALANPATSRKDKAEAGQAGGYKQEEVQEELKAKRVEEKKTAAPPLPAEAPATSTVVPSTNGSILIVIETEP